mmetsp:Transcript_25050/g.41559  ORF Transcript_25050/g.41559 Transcript_25050/m.41559 type:complete len:232 (+) Transcript_25050:119-814(+)
MLFFIFHNSISIISIIVVVVVVFVVVLNIILFGQFIHHIELSFPFGIVQKLSQIKSIVIRRIPFGMIRRGQSTHFVSIDGIIIKEALDFLRHDRGFQTSPNAVAARSGYKCRIHADRTTPMEFAQSTKPTEFLVGHAHFIFIQLRMFHGGCVCFCCCCCIAVMSNFLRPQFRRGRCSRNFLQHRIILRAMEQHLFQIDFGNGTNRIQIGRTAIVFRHVSPQAFIDIGTAQD